MPRRKPMGWPAYMVPKRLKRGSIAYYWAPPTWAVRDGCPVGAEALGSDYAIAKRRCDDILNPAFTEWRTKGAAVSSIAPVVGTFDWLRLKAETTPRFRRRGQKLQKQDRQLLQRVANYRLKDGDRIGDQALAAITPGTADRLIEKLGRKSDGTLIARTALAIATACKSAWTWVHRDHPTVVPATNPFAKMIIDYKAQKTRPVTLEELNRFVAAADAAGEVSIGTAALISYFWMMRQTDVIGRFTWTQYRPAHDPNVVVVWHHKTDEEVKLPLYDGDGSMLWPEVMERLDASPRLGTLVVTRDHPDHRRKVHLPWKADYFRHRVAAIRKAAGIDDEAKFMGLRHGGHTAAADAELTDAQLRALSGHKTANVTLLYAQATKQQRVAGARKMRDARTKRDGLSE